MDLLIVLFLILFLIKKYIPKEKENYLSIEYTTYLKGILALIVVFCHIQYNRIDFQGFKIFNYIGDFAVSMFFFFSGYGLISQYAKKKEEYLKSFINKRIFKIAKIYILFIFIYTLVYFLNGTFTGINSVLDKIFSEDLIVSHSWYIIDILILYMVFYISARIFKEDYKKISLFIIAISLILIVGFILLGYSESWYVSVLSFSLGIIYKIYLEKKINYKNIILTVIGLILLEISQIIINKFDSALIILFVTALIKNLACMCFSVLIVNLGKKVQFRNPLFKFIGNISLEVYLIHGLFENIFKNIDIVSNNNLLYGSLVLSTSIISSYIIHKAILQSRKEVIKK